MKREKYFAVTTAFFKKKAPANQGFFSRMENDY